MLRSRLFALFILLWMKSSISYSFDSHAYINGVIPFGASTFSSKQSVGWLLVDCSDHKLILYGSGFEKGQKITSDSRLMMSFTTSEFGCDAERIERTFSIVAQSDTVAYVNISLPKKGVRYFICLRMNVTEHFSVWIHQGSESTKTILIKTRWMPTWLMICMVFSLVAISGLFSGLNLGLMSLTLQDLDIIISSNEDPKMVEQAMKIKPIRKRGNLLLCSILLGNVLVNTITTIMLDELTNGIYAVTLSTMAIVIFGEIIPQAICSRHGLRVGAATVLWMKLVILMTYVLAKPLSFILDKVLGEEAGSAYTRGQVVELVRRNVPSISDTERHILSGMLALNKRQVGDIMIPLRNVFMLNENSAVNHELYFDIYQQGFTRIPVYKENRENVIGILHMRDFAFVDPDSSNLKVANILSIFNHPLGCVESETGIMSLFDTFKQGQYHIALVTRQESEYGTTCVKIAGIVTLEDVIEEIFQSKIYDEWDHVTPSDDPALKKKRILDYSSFLKPKHKDSENFIPPQQKVAIYRFLKEVEAFKEPFISCSVLEKLINTPHLYVEHKFKKRMGPESNTPNKSSSDLSSCRDQYLYEYGKPANHYTLILSGKAQLETGKDKILSSVGPFNHFGISILLDPDDDVYALTSPSNHVPIINRLINVDFSLRLEEDLTCLRITRAVWLAAVRTSILQTQLGEFNIPVEEANRKLDEQIGKLMDNESRSKLSHPDSFIKTDKNLTISQISKSNMTGRNGQTCEDDDEFSHETSKLI